MRTINVIVLQGGVLQSNRLYLSTDESTDDHVLKAAENRFKEQAKKINSELSTEEIENALGEGGYDNMNGKEVLISWPEIIDFIPS
jgi:hypothetical protein